MKPTVQPFGDSLRSPCVVNGLNDVEPGEGCKVAPGSSIDMTAQRRSRGIGRSLDTLVESRLFKAAAKSMIANNRRAPGKLFAPNRVTPWLIKPMTTTTEEPSSPKARFRVFTSTDDGDDDDRAACDTAGFELAQHCAVGGGGAPTAEEAKDERALTCGGDGVDEARSDDNGGDLLAPRPLGLEDTGTGNSLNWSSWSGRDRRFR